MHPVEFTWYKAIVLIISALALGIGIMNVVYFNRIRLNSSNCEELTTSQTTAALWLNVILVIVAIFTLFWSFFRLIHTEEELEDNIIHETTNIIKHSPEPMKAPAPPVFSYAPSSSSLSSPSAQ